MTRWSLAGHSPLVLVGRVALLALLGISLPACDEAPLKQTSVPLTVDAGPPIAGLSPDQAARVVARVDDRVITLGDFARALERMDQFDRLRYQSKERRRELLEEMIDVQLLAGEARRRGLDKDPEAADAQRMILRDAILADGRGGMPAPAQISDQEVRAYFEAHPEKFSEPERRRVAAIVMSDKNEAAKILKEALKVKSPGEWGELWFKHSLTAPKVKSASNPAELAGDLGIVGPVGDARGANPKVPEPVRAAAFKLKAVNEVGAELVESEGRWFVIRLNGLTQPHKRSFAEADRAIRVLLVQEKMAEKERALEDELKKKFPVEIDDAVLAGVKLPAATEKSEGAGHEAPGPAGQQEAPGEQPKPAGPHGGQ